jgi:hypothetical protein
MLTIRPVGRAAWARVRPSIRKAGEAGTCGRLRRLINRGARPTGFCMRAPIVRGGLPVGPPSIQCAQERPAIMPRTELETSLHRLANQVECQLVDLFRELLAESRHGDARDVAYSGCGFIESLRDVRGNKEGGDA